MIWWIWIEYFSKHYRYIKNKKSVNMQKFLDIKLLRDFGLFCRHILGIFRRDLTHCWSPVGSPILVMVQPSAQMICLWIRYFCIVGTFSESFGKMWTCTGMFYISIFRKAGNYTFDSKTLRKNENRLFQKIQNYIEIINNMQILYLRGGNAFVIRLDWSEYYACWKGWGGRKQSYL